MKLRRAIYLFAAALSVVAALLVCQRPDRSSQAFAAPVPAVNNADGAIVDAYLKTHCIECHNAKVQKGDISLHLYHDEASVLKDRKVFEDVLEKVRAGEMPPKKKARPAKADADEFIHGIERIFYRHDLTVPLDPGHVTVRRLNRTEYDNTIRDLVGVDVQASENFPSDDVGQGFDNIGDVLSLSPVLMERYLTAAEMVMERAIPILPLPPVHHYMDGVFLEPSIRKSALPKNTHRPIKANDELFTTYHVADDGVFTFRARVYPDHPDDEGQAAVVALTVDGNAVQTFEVRDGDNRKRTILETKVALSPGEHRFGIKMVSSWENDPNWILRVRNLEWDGPPDTRPHSERVLLECDPSVPHHEQTRQILKRFASRAYRRPVTDDETDRLTNLAEQAEAGGAKWKAAIQLAMQGVLISPKFLFRVELDDRPISPGPHPIDDYQLASRLSYFLWSTMPDQELFDLAAKKQLSANLEQQVRRMLLDPKSQALVDNFAMQWLQLRRLKNFSPDPTDFPHFDERLRAAMLTETSLFFGSIIREDRSIIDLIDADYTFLNERLAQHYGIGDTNGNPAWIKPITTPGARIKGSAFVRVHLADHRRGGVLTEASVLCVTSNPTRTSPVKRGKFVLEQILGVPPPPPPPNVPQLPSDSKAVSSGSLRHRMEEHRANPACANCHEHMDGIGFAFENFNAVGEYRWKDGGFDIDPSGTMPDGSSFKGVVELKSMLAMKKDLFSRCLSKKLLTYALGRGVEYYDQRAVEKIVSALERNDYKFSTLVIEIAKSDPFRLCRGKEQNP
ncbi:MAG TPA: DUF1592 domain-containing protein [Tepidisphaeraceae bacterium]|nr:DUF1592 domain-containing protein [Tepidisphaeraceae bacterium]